MAAVAYVVVHESGADRFIAGDTEGLNVLITLIGSIYAVVFAFVIFVIWGQFTEVENCGSCRNAVHSMNCCASINI